MKRSEEDWEAFVDKAMKEAGLESAPDHFTDKVMLSMESQLAKKRAIAYNPPISKLTWAIIISITSALLVWTLITGTALEFKWIPARNLNMDLATVWEGLSFPSLNYTALYSIGAFALFVCVQLLIMKRRFDQRFRLD